MVSSSEQELQPAAESTSSEDIAFVIAAWTHRDTLIVHKNRRNPQILHMKSSFCNCPATLILRDYRQGFLS
jgi:hypothetical protein